MQRFFDLLFSGLALMALSPLLIPIIIFLRITGEGEVFYLQDRIGINGKVFKLYKFATMLKNSPNMTTGTVTVKNDPRVLPAGKFLRKTKINELPQLLNIFFGDMSVIGPRPLTQQTFDMYEEGIQSEVTKVRPGLSGIGSVIFRDEENILTGKNNPIDFYCSVVAPYKGCLEIWYVKNKCLRTYFLIIIITICVVIYPKSRLPWHVFSDLPIPPKQLKTSLNYLE